MEILKNFEQNVENYVGAVKTRFISVNGAQTELDSKVADNQSDIDTLDASFKAYVEDHDAAHYQLGRDAENVDASIAELKSNIGVLDKKIADKIEEQAESATGEFTKIRSEFQAADASIREEMSQMDADLRDYAMTATGVQFVALINRIDTSFQEVRTDISTFENNVNTWQTEHENDYQALVAEDAAIRNDISIIDASIRNDLGVNIGVQFVALTNAIDTSFQAVYSDISTLESNVNTWQLNHETEYHALVDKDAAHDASLSALETNVTALDTSLNAWITNHESEYQALVAEDASVHEEIERNCKQYALTTTSTYFGGLNSSVGDAINAVRADISTLESNVNTWQTDHESDYQALVDNIGTTADTSVASTVYGKIAEIMQIIEDNELICAQAFAALDARLTAAGI